MFVSLFHKYTRLPRPNMSFLASVGSLFGWFSEQPQTSDAFTPSYNDVCQARAELIALKLPTELVLEILDHAEYWPQHEFYSKPERPLRAAPRFPHPSSAALCLDVGIFNNPTVNPIRKGGETPKIKSLEFDIVSRDQGWTTERTTGTYQTSSWLEASILRSVHDADFSHLPGPEFLNTRFHDPSEFQTALNGRGWYLVKRPVEAEQGPQDGEGDFAWYLQGNRVAAKHGEYRVVWADDGAEGDEGAGKGAGFLKELKDGDRVLIWARAKVRHLTLTPI